MVDLTFLAPIPGLIAMAITVPALLAFYFLKLRRRPVRVSSTLLWERAVHDLQVNTPFRMLRLSWLLLLQLAVLLALLAAFARPALEGSPLAGGRVVLLIDRSASMRAVSSAGDEPEPATRLDTAKRLAEETLQRLIDGPGLGVSAEAAQVVVVDFAAQARARTPLTTDSATAREAIRSIVPTDQPDDLAEALRLVGALAPAVEGDPEAETTPATTVFLFTDGVLDAEAGIAGLLPAGAQLRTVRVDEGAGDGAAAPPPANTGIVSLSARRDYDDPAIVRIFVRLARSSSAPDSTPLELRLDAQPVQTASVAFPPPAAPGAGADAGSARDATHTFTLENTDGGLLSVAITRPDALASDDIASLVLDRPTDPRILVVAPGAAGAGADPFLMSALEAIGPQRLAVVGPAQYASLADPADPASVERFNLFDLVIFDRESPGALPPVPSISLGAGLPLPGLEVDPLDAEAAPAAPERFVSWRRTHPVLRYVALESVLIAPPMRLTLPEAGGGFEFTPLAWGGEGPLIVLVDDERGGGPSRIVVGFELARTNWGPDVSFPLFMANAVDVLTGRGDADAGRLLSTTDPVTLLPAPGAESVIIDGPLRRTVEVDRSAGARLVTAPLPIAGVYAVQNAAPEGRLLAVNLLSERESRLESVLRAADASADASAPSPAARGLQGAGDERPPKEIWHWFVLGALGLLCLEWVLYAWRMRS